MPLAIVSTTAIHIVTAFTVWIHSPTTVHSGSSASDSATPCARVLSLPIHAAATT